MNTRNTVVLLVVFLALLAGAVYLSRNETESVNLSEGTATATPLPLIELEASDVQEVIAHSEEGTITFARVAGGWEVDGQPAAEHVDGTLSRLANPSVVRELPADAEPEDYGFAITPTMTITMTTQDGTATVLEVGDETVIDSNVYIRQAGQSRIVTISNFEVNQLRDWISEPPLAPTATPEGGAATADATDADAADEGEADETGTPEADATSEAAEDGTPDATVPAPGSESGTPGSGGTATDEADSATSDADDDTGSSGSQATSTSPSGTVSP